MSFLSLPFLALLRLGVMSTAVLNLGSTGRSRFRRLPFGVCFPLDSVGFDYDICCRDSLEMRLRCFNETRSFERCCTYPFGPEIRGLPHKGDCPPHGPARLNMGSAGLLEFSLNSIEEGSLYDGANQIWWNGWFFGRLMADFDALLLHARDTWPEMAQRASHLASPLKVLEVGCGAGPGSIAAARGGHNVTAVDMDTVAIETTKGNAQRNDVQLNIVQWDMFSAVPLELRRSGPFDVVLAEVGHLFVRELRDKYEYTNVDWRAINSKFLMFMHNLQTIGLKHLVLVGKYRVDREGPDKVTTCVLYALSNYAEQVYGWRMRQPLFAPPDWLQKAGLGPRNMYALIWW